MKEKNANLWNFHEVGFQAVVTTNIGWDEVWNKKLRGFRPLNNMGAGSVLEAATRWPELPEWYGRRCREYKTEMPVLWRPDMGLVFLPVKPLMTLTPSWSWNQKASLVLIRRGLDQIRDWWEQHQPKIVMTLPGAGNGGLPPGEVLALVRVVLGHTDIVVADYRMVEAQQTAPKWTEEALVP